MIKKNRKNTQYDMIILTDFKKLDPEDFEAVHGDLINIRKEIILCSYDGRVYINKRFEGAELLYGVFNALMYENIDTLKEYARECEETYTGIKTFDDWVVMKDTNVNKVHALAMLCIPIEMQRRDFVMKYYNCSIK